MAMRGREGGRERRSQRKLMRNGICRGELAVIIIVSLRSDVEPEVELMFGRRDFTSGFGPLGGKCPSRLVLCAAWAGVA